jgi:RNA polymerase sigma-70 factor (ECF subfamily)
VLHFPLETKDSIMESTAAPNEPQLIRAAQRGDMAAFSTLVKLHHGKVRAFLAVRMNNALEAEDLAQDTLILAFKKLPELDPERPMGAWLRGVAKHLLANHRRKFRAIPIGANEELQSLIDAQLEKDFHQQDESERMTALRDCLEQLEPPARQLLHDRYADETPLDDLAQRLGRKTSAVSMQLHRLRQMLATCIETKVSATT